MANMEQIREDMKVAFDMISTIPVSGDSVELMAAAKERLRRAYKEMEKKNEDVTDNG